MMNFMTPGPALAQASDDCADGNDGYVRIGEVAKEFGVTLRALRFYEDKGLLEPRREGSTRLYTSRDRARLRLILLGRKVGFSLREVKQMLDLYNPQGPNTRQLRLVLDKSERQMTKLEKQRSLIDEAMRDLANLVSEVNARLSKLKGGDAA